MARIVLALGGNALQTSGALTAEDQKRVARDTARRIVDLIEQGNELVITHGNGPQVGDILLGEEASASPTNAVMPLETTVAMSQGQIGYWLQQAIGNELWARDIFKSVVTLVTQVVVDQADPAFSDPTKPIGPFYDETEAKALASKNHWVVKEDAGRGWRRVVPSPKPQKIVEVSVVRAMIEQGIVPIVAGGGGVPVLEDNQSLRGIDAVIDKDFAAAKLAETIGADILMILTAVDNVTINYKTAAETPLGKITVEQLDQYTAENQFAAGSMLPKIQALTGFIKNNPSRTAIITSLEKSGAALAGEAGTIISQ